MVDGSRLQQGSLFGFLWPISPSAYLASSASSTELRDWASVIMMVSDIEFDDIETGDGSALLDALGAAAAGEDVPEQALDVARKPLSDYPPTQIAKSGMRTSIPPSVRDRHLGVRNMSTQPEAN